MIYIALVLVLVLLSVLVASWSSAPFLPTRTADLPRVLKLANLKEGQKFYDLGCGNGKVVFYIGKNSKAKSVGIEMALPIYFWAKIKQIFSGCKNCNILYKNFFKVDLTDVDVVYIFGYPISLKLRVAKKLQKELKPGARIISYSFKIADWQPVEVDKPAKDQIPIYIYQIKDKV